MASIRVWRWGEGRWGEAGRETLVDSGHFVRDVLWVVAFALLLAVSAQARLYLPGMAIPVTAQTVVVLLCGFWLRPRLAMSAVVLYLVLGLFSDLVSARLPFFAALRVGGAAATFGYLVGFVLAAGLVSFVSRQFRRIRFGHALAVGFLGTAVIFLFGVSWLALLTGSFERAIQIGVLPFAGWAVIKIGVVASLVQVRGLTSDQSR